MDQDRIFESTNEPITSSASAIATPSRRFKVTKATVDEVSDDAFLLEGTDGRAAPRKQSAPPALWRTPQSGASAATKKRTMPTVADEEKIGENTPWVTDDDGRLTPVGVDAMALYEEEYAHRPKVAHIIRSLSIYSPLQPGTGDEERLQKAAGGAKMGTFMGVFMPCIQNIFGVLFFIRLTWIVGTAGILQSFFVVLVCCMVTFTTSISMSAIATNGMVPPGGPYALISRNLGPELGGAVGMLFYLGTTIAASMYIVGAAEIFVLYLLPAAKLWDDVFNCYRLYGTILLLLLACIVLAGVRVVNKFALPTVLIVLLCIILTFIGAFVKFNGSDQLSFCVVGDRIANMKKWTDDHSGRPSPNCSAESLKEVYCNTKDGKELCNAYYVEILKRNASLIRPERAITGIASGVFMENFNSKYLEQDQFMSTNRSEHGKQNEEEFPYYVVADLTTSFMVLVGVFFPSVTGIMAGSNRSGDLRDPSTSIPRGTIAATTITSLTYLLGVVVFGASLSEMFVRDKFGESAFGKQVIAQLAVPHPMVLMVGSFLATTGAGMQSLTGAPRLLSAIAKDGVIPLLAPFSVTTKRGEPLRAILMTLAICEVGILIAMLESITALISQFFLMCYLGVNAACALQSLLKAPSWRPRFRYYHWSFSLFGAALCIAVMFISHWGFALAAIVVGIVVYKYIEYRGAEKEWGDGIRGVGLSAARYALLTLEDREEHTKNWRPQVLVLVGMTPDNEVVHEKALAFASQLKAGRGLTVVATVLAGTLNDMSEQAAAAKKELKIVARRYKIKGFCEVLVSRDITEGICALLQTSGLGSMKHNTVLMNWPTQWRAKDILTTSQRFVDCIRSATAAKLAILLAKNADEFPDNITKMSGKMDVWWIVHDGGMLMLLPFLLRQHRAWRHTQLRVFTVAGAQDNTVKMKDDLRTFLYHLRIEAEVDVIELQESDISDFTYERTLRMEQRSKMLRDLGLSKKERANEIQTLVMDAHHVPDVNVLRRVSEDDAAVSVPAELETPGTDVTALSPTSPARKGVTITIDPPNDHAPVYSSAAKPTVPNGQNAGILQLRQSQSQASLPAKFFGLHSYNVRRMHTAVKLNEIMKSRSQESELVFVNLPPPPKEASDDAYMEFIEALTEGLNRVVLVRGSGTEVVTMYS